MPQISILQLEDSELDADLERAALERAGIEFELYRVERRAEFESALQEKHFDLILADFHLPDFNGLDALSIAQATAPETPFIFVSGMLGEELAIDSLRNGATDYVLKIRLERLAPAVQRAISESRERLERRRVEAALAETEDRFRKMADSAPVMIWTSGPDKKWDYCNRRWMEFTGIAQSLNICAEWISLVHPQDLDRVIEKYDRAFETTEEFMIEHRLRREDGQYRWIVNSAVPRFDERGRLAGFIGSCTDVTELKAAEERLRHAAKLESLGILAGGIAHDFNNLLTGIMGNASLVLDELPRGSRHVPFVESIVQASETAAQLTRQMLAYSGKGHFVLERVDLSRQVREILPLVEASVPRLVELRLDLARDLPAVEADPAQIQQLVMNLVINGAEAVGETPGGLVTVSTDVKVFDGDGVAHMLSGFSVTPGRYVMLRVQDNGHGMDHDTRARIFDPFFTTKFTGRGLGLAAVSGIMRGHKGGIALTSEPGKGTDFRFYFPVQGDMCKTAVEGPDQTAQCGTGTILVVDDEAVVTRTARLTLSKYGYTVLTAQNGKEAVDLFRALAPEIDLVLLDLTMPVMTGEIAFQQIREIRPDVRVIATSGYNEAEAFSRFGDGVDAFIQKPYRAAQLAEKVHAVLGQKTQSGETAEPTEASV